MSASLQYSDYSGQAEFCVPYGVIKTGKKNVKGYLKTQQETMDMYESAIEAGIDNDSAGYMAPQGLRNILIISATPYQWKHMISQRVCRRNTDETRYVMLLIWKELSKLSEMFAECGPFCMKREGCREGKMSCGRVINREWSPEDILYCDFPLFAGGGSL
jgi:thymidylate synthase (FAD)